MQIEREIRDIKLDDIDEIEWLKIRQSDNHDAEPNNLHHLGLSMATRATTPADPSAPCSPVVKSETISANSPTSWEDFLLRMPVGQLAPIRVIRYPYELQPLPKDYGLIFGYRRWQAAKQRGLTTIKAQVIHLSIQEYRDDKTRFYLLLMGFTENAEREPLSGMEYFKAVKRLKDKYEAIYPKSSKHFKHLTQTRNIRGHFESTTQQAPPSFNRALRRITKKSKRTIHEDLQIADLLSSAILDNRYKEPIHKSVALLLTEVPQDRQVIILDQLASQHLPFTTDNIKKAIGKSNKTYRKPPVSADSALTDGIPQIQPLNVSADGASLPDLAIVKATITLCLNLRHRFAWTPTTIREALPVFDDLLSALQTLTDYLRHEKAVLDGHPSKTVRTATQNDHQSNGRTLKLAHR